MCEVTQAIEAVWKNESARLVAAIARVTRDIGVAEELAGDALVAALELWPLQGIPPNPGAWLMTAAKHRAIDGLRRHPMLDRKHDELTRELEAKQKRIGEEIETSFDQVIEDDILRLLFTACHPVLPVEGRIALTLRVIGGLTTAEIARAFLVPEKTMGQRVTRAKKTLADAKVPFETPQGKELQERVQSVLLVLYLVFNEGYTATSGEEWSRAALVEEALRLARTLIQLAPKESEAHALLALMELNASRTAARRGPGGEAILLPDQDRALWNRAQIRRGFSSLDRAITLGGRAESYALQASIAACHARAARVEDTDWTAVVMLYDDLLQCNPSPVVELNRAVAISMTQGPAAGLAALDRIQGLGNYYLLPSVRGDFLLKVGDVAGARRELARAISLTTNTREIEMLTARLNGVGRISSGAREKPPPSVTFTTDEHT